MRINRKCTTTHIVFLMVMLLVFRPVAAQQPANSAGDTQMRSEANIGELPPPTQVPRMIQEAMEYADRLSADVGIKEFTDSTGCAVRVNGFYNQTMKQGEKPNSITIALMEGVKKFLGKDAGITNQPRIGIDIQWTGLNDGFREGQPSVSTRIETTPTVGSHFAKENVEEFTNAIASYSDTSLNIADSHADECVVKELLALQKKGKEISLPYFPWMNHAVSEAKTMTGISECDEPLFTKGKEYHKEGGGSNFCPCGKTKPEKHANYCDPSAWCASFANWCLKKSNTAYTNSAGSQTFLKHSGLVKVTIPIFGAIAVFTNLDGNGDFKPTGHVAFVVGKIEGDKILCLGGNQGDMIKVSQYSLSQDKIKMANKLLFRGYYIPQTYSDKIKEYKTEVLDYTSEATANQQIINLNIGSTDNESTR